MILMNNNSMQDESGFSEVNVANNLSEVCFDILESVTQAIIVVVIALSFVVKIVSVKGWSMLNTLRDADRLVVMKWRCGSNKKGSEFRRTDSKENNSHRRSDSKY